MIRNKIHLISPGCPHPSIALQVQNRGLKQNSFISNHNLSVYNKIDKQERNPIDLSYDGGVFQGNAIYNIMPDMVSRLSDPEIGVDEEHFRIIMKWVIIELYRVSVAQWWHAGTQVEQSILHQGYDL